MAYPRGFGSPQYPGSDAPQPQYPGIQSFPPNSGGYPAAGSPAACIPGQQSPYPANPLYPPCPPQEPSYPPQEPFYPSQQQFYPPQQPPPQTFCSPQQPSYPPQQPSYPPQQPSYPPQQPSYPPQQPSYPPQQPSPQQPSYPPQQPSYPPQQPYNPPQQSPSSFPQQQQSFPPGVQGGVTHLNTNGEQIKEGTVKSFAQFDPEADCKTLQKAMKGLFKDEGSVIHVLANRSNQQRQQLKLKYKVLLGKDLSHELHSDFGGNFGEALHGMMMTPTEFDAYCLHKGIEGLGTNNHVLIEILCTRRNETLLAIKQEYKSKFNHDLEVDVVGETSGDFKRLLVSMLACSRDENFQVDMAKAKADAERLYEAGESRWRTDESIFHQILASRSFTQLRATFQAYAKLSKNDMEHVVEKELSGHIKEGMVAIVKCVKDESSFFSEKLYHALKGLGTDNHTLVRVIVSRSEVDMVNIKNAFRHHYGKTIGSFIKGDTSGHYEKLLLALLREEC